MSTIIQTITSFTLYISIFIINPSQSQTETVTCNRDISSSCGPCTSSSNTACNLKCASGEDVCVEIGLTCQSGIPCNIECSALYACMGSTIDASSATALTIACSGVTGCESTAISAATNADVTITCSGGENSCNEMILNARTANNIIINCNGWNSCTGTVINAQSAGDVTSMYLFIINFSIITHFFCNNLCE